MIGSEDYPEDVVDEFLCYLLHQQSFRDCMVNSAHHVGGGKPQRRAVKALLGRMIGDDYLTLSYRPAIMRLAVGDRSLVDRLDVPDDIETVLRRNRGMVRRSVTRCVHDVGLIGPRHALALEAGVEQRTRPHASKFAYRRARFLGMGENGKKHMDILHDIELFGIRCFRWYYPFRCDVHMDNTVRTTITNRGLSYVKHHTRQCRGRMVTDENGVTQNMEGHDQLAFDQFSPNTSEERDALLRIDMSMLIQRGDTLGSIARIISDDDEQENFLQWLRARSKRAARHDVLTEAVRACGKPYDYLLGKYLKVDVEDATDALRVMQTEVA